KQPGTGAMRSTSWRILLRYVERGSGSDGRGRGAGGEGEGSGEGGDHRPGDDDGVADGGRRDDARGRRRDVIYARGTDGAGRAGSARIAGVGTAAEGVGMEDRLGGEECRQEDDE